MPAIIQGVQYSGIWTMQQVNAAIAAGTWPSPPQPHLFAWGAGGSGQLGDGSLSYKSSPTQVGTLTTWSSIKAGRQSTWAVKTDGTLWAWGANSFGKLGTGNTTSYSLPKQIGALTNWLKVSGRYAGQAIKTDGTLWAWGYNVNNELGTGTGTVSSPVQVGSSTLWLNASTQYTCSAGVRTDGTLWTWGKNNKGQLGLGNTTEYGTPQQVGGLTNWLSVSCGSYWMTAIKTDGTLWAWGWNNRGQLGQGTIDAGTSSPVQVGALTTWLAVSAGYYGSLALRTNGTIWLIGTANYRSSPTQIGSATNWSSVVSGGEVGVNEWWLATNTSGNLYSWGYNAQGQLGQGNTTSINWASPTIVGSLTSWTTITAGSNHALGIALT